MYSIDKIESVAKTKFIELKTVHYTDERGRKRNWDMVSRWGNSQGAVVIVATLKATDEIILVKQYRVPMQNYVLEFPAGLIDGEEEPAAAAIRELSEETGYEGKIRDIFPSSPSSPGMSNECATLVSIDIDEEDLQRHPPKPHPEDTEDIEVILVKRSRLREYLLEQSRAGVAVDSKLFAYILN